MERLQRLAELIASVQDVSEIRSILNKTQYTRDDIDDLIDQADRVYYNGEYDTLVSDFTYDLLREYRADRNDRPSAAPPSRKKVEHPDPFKNILSGIDRKFNSIEKMQQFFSYYSHIVDTTVARISPKIDGSSALFVINSPQQRFLGVTRGRDNWGIDISDKFKHYFVILSSICANAHLAVRVELFLSEKQFQKLCELQRARGERVYANARVASSGLIARNHTPREYLDCIEIMIISVHDAQGNRISIDSEQFTNFPTITVLPRIERNTRWLLDNYHEYYSQVDEWLAHTYDMTRPVSSISTRRISIDGLVVELFTHDTREPVQLLDSHSVYQNVFAIKFPPEARTTQIVNIELNMGSNGAIVPTVVTRPVELNATVQSRVGMGNFQNLAKRKTFPGAIVDLSLNNDVIPYIQYVRAEAAHTYEPPKHCPFCNCELIEYNSHVMCVNDQCTELRVQRMLAFIRAFDRGSNVGESAARTLVRYNVGVNHLFCEEYFRKTDFIRATSMRKSFLEFLETWIWTRTSDHDILKALWFTGIGTVKAKKITSRFTVCDLVSHNTTNELVHAKNAQIDRTTSSALDLFYLPMHRSARIEYWWIYCRQHERARWRDTALAPATLQFAMTGTIPDVDRTTIARHMSQLRHTMIDRVNKQTDYLVVGDNPGSTKLRAAHRRKIPIIPARDFCKKYDIY